MKNQSEKSTKHKDNKINYLKKKEINVNPSLPKNFKFS